MDIVRRRPGAFLPACIASGLLFAAPAQGQQAVPLPPGVVGGGAGATLVQADPAATAQTNMRIDRLEGELRALTGQMEQLMFQMRQLQEELRRAREDTEFRLQELEGGAPPAQRSEVPVTDEQVQQALGTPPRDLGTLSVDANGQPVGAAVGVAPLQGGAAPLDLSSLTLGGDPSARASAPIDTAAVSGDPAGGLAPGELYDLGYNHVLRGDYGAAITTFEDFLGRYEVDPLRPNAHFWLGESHFARGEYTPAAEQFLAVFNRYPEDVKVPDALLKLAMSLSRMGATEQACATFSKLLTDYPRAPQIVLDTARGEQAGAGC